MKKILKKLFPIPFLKAAFLVYNKVKINTIDKILFREFKVSTDQFYVFRKGHPFKESGIYLDDLPDGEVKGYMLQWRNWTQEEFLLKLDVRCFIEPDYGWCIVGFNRLVYYSIAVSRTWFQRKPDLLRFLINKEKSAVKVSNAISLRDSGEENYFHFYNDVLAKLFFLRNSGIDIESRAVIISRKLWEKEYFKYYFSNSPFLKSLNWVVQDNKYICCESVIFCKPLTHRRDLWTEIRSSFAKVAASDDRKIFITRRKSRLRFIENIEAIEGICLKHGFVIIDADALPLKEQVEVFSTALFLVGIHGAGLTNMIFRNGSCSVLELFPPPDLGYLPFHYIMLAKMHDFKYSALIGEAGKSKYSGGFHMPTEKFENALVSFLSSMWN